MRLIEQKDAFDASRPLGEQLVAIIHEVSRSQTLSELMETVKKAARMIGRADGVTFVLRDGDFCHYADEDTIAPLWKGQRFPAASCVSGMAMQTGETIFIPDIYRDERVPIALYKATFIKSMLMIPVGLDPAVAAIGVYWKVSTRPEETALTALETIANSAALVLSNLNLLRDLKYQNLLFSSFMNHAPFAAAVRDPSGAFLFVNPKMAEVFGLKPDVMLGKNALEISPNSAVKESVIRSMRDDSRILETMQPTHLLAESTSPSGDVVHWLLHKFPIVDRQRQLLIGIIAMDITPQIIAERAKELAQAQLKESFKLATLGEVAGNIAHEINNPLTIISGRCESLLQTLQRDPNNVEKLDHSARSALDMSRRIAAIVNGLRTFMRNSDRDAPALTHLAPLVHEAAALCSHRFNAADIQLLIDPIDADVAVECRPTEISQVLVNLINNAIDATLSLRDRWVKVSVSHEGEGVTLAVTDSGSGIPESVRNKIMSPFFTTKAPGQGTGLGLSISKGLVEGHGGRLEIDGACKNTRFLVTLPARAIAAPST